MTSNQSLRRFGKYRTIAKLGEGGMAEVYAGYADEATSLGKVVVLKVLRETLACDDEAVTMFLDEARLASRVQHANVVQVYEAGASDGHYAIVMEYLAGAPFSALRRRARAQGEFLPLPVSLRILTDALRGLHHAHELDDADGTFLNVVHRDFTASNIFVTVEGHTKVLDFGISKARDHFTQTRQGILKGTAGYMSPEAISGNAVDRRADIFAAGAVLWSMLAGDKIWRGLNGIAKLQKTLTGEFPPWPEGVEIPRELERVCRKAMSFDREDRFATAEDMRHALREAAKDVGGLAETETVAEAVATLIGEECAERSKFFRKRLAEERTGDTFVEFPQFGEISSTTSLEHQEIALQPPPASEPQKKVWPLIAGGAAVVALIAGGGVAWAISQSGADELPHASTEPAAPRAEPVARSVRVRVTVSPSEARIFVDDRLLPGNPVEVTLDADEEEHELRAEADGYEPQSVPLQLTGDVRTHLTLRPSPAPEDGEEPANSVASTTRPRPGRRPGLHRPSPSAPPTSDAADTPAPAEPTRTINRPSFSGSRQLDEDNPWAN